MEFPIRFPAPFLNTSPLPRIRSGPSPYISTGTYPAPYLNYSPSPYATSAIAPYITSGIAPYASTDPAPYTSYTDASRCKAPYPNSDPAPSTHSSYSDISSGSASYASSDSASCGNCSYASDLAMDTSQELSIDEEEYHDGKDLAINDSGISCSDDSESGQSGARKVRGSGKRKCFEPCRTMLQDDPDFRGVTVTMENKLVDSEWMFIMHSTFSLPPKKKRKFRAYVDSSDEEDINNNFTPIAEEKHCASCSVKKTPLWRDAEDGTPLCNACGIRYKKYKLRCGTCWHIPKKDEFRPTCQYCGSFYEYIYPRR